MYKKIKKVLTCCLQKKLKFLKKTIMSFKNKLASKKEKRNIIKKKNKPCIKNTLTLRCQHVTGVRVIIDAKENKANININFVRHLIFSLKSER